MVYIPSFFRDWLEKHAHLLATAVYTFLRVIVDHTSPNFATLRQREVEFCITMLREKWTDCMAIGRDLVRLLQYVARIPEFEKLWKDILYNPTVLSPQFTGECCSGIVKAIEEVVRKLFQNKGSSKIFG